MEDFDLLEPFSNTSNDTELLMAGFGPRWGALLVDVNILLILFAIFSESAVNLVQNSNLVTENISNSFVVGAIAMYLIGIPLLGILYHSICECSRLQGSLGKVAVKIKVVDRNGDKLSFIHAFGRNAGKIFSGLILYIGFFMAIWTEQKQTLHDVMAKTYVVLKRQ